MPQLSSNVDLRCSTYRFCSHRTANTKRSDSCLGLCTTFAYQKKFLSKKKKTWLTWKKRFLLVRLYQFTFVVGFNLSAIWVWCQPALDCVLARIWNKTVWRKSIFFHFLGARSHVFLKGYVFILLTRLLSNVQVLVNKYY